MPAGVVALKAFPDLSFHCVTFEPENVIELVSAPSNHNPHPMIEVGRNAGPPANRLAKLAVEVLDT